MIIEKQKLSIKPNWKKSEYNRWADFVELLCLKDGIITVDDMIDIWHDADTENEYERGGMDHSEKADMLEGQIKDYFTLLNSRNEECGEYYPFEVQEGNCLVLKSEQTDKHKQYIFLLICSSISFMNNSNLQQYTAEFEKFSKDIMSILIPNEAVVELFGTTRSDGLFGGNLRSRIEQLASLLGASTTKSFDENSKYDNINGGDDGLDIVAFFPLDGAQTIPFAFAQCTCSFDKWKEKQDSVSLDRWSKKIDPLVHYPIFMFVPFSCHDNQGRFYDATNIRTFLIDRIRILKLLNKNNDEQFQEKIKEVIDLDVPTELFLSLED